MTVRRGKDNVEDTLDDYVFLRTFDVATEVNQFVKLELSEIHAIDALNAQGLIDHKFFKLCHRNSWTSCASKLVEESTVVYSFERK